MKKESEIGYIEYKKPNMLEGLEFMAKMGLNSGNLSNTEELMNNDLYYTAQAIKGMKDFITKIDIKIDDDVIDTYEMAIDRIETMPLLMEVAGDLMSFMQVDAKKKA